MSFNIKIRLKNITVYLMLTCSLTFYGQSLSNEDIKILSEKLNSEFRGVDVDPSSGVKGRGVFSLGRKLVYQYDVPDNWKPFDNVKQMLIHNLIESGNTNLYVKGQVDVGYYYFKKDRLIKSVDIEWEELTFKLGDYIELTNHPKSNGLEYKIKKPLGWEIKEGDGPHIVKKFTSGKNIYLIYINETGQFFTKKEVQEFFENETDREEFINEFSKSNEFDIKINKVVTIERYPFIYTSGSIQQERMGIELNGTVHFWMSFIEDQFIYFMGSSYSEEDSYMDFFRITNSIKLLNQY